jgi:sugar phosphate isomerase/epimerase
MSYFSIGVISGLHPSPREALQTVRDLGLDHIQLQYPAHLDSDAGIQEIQSAASEYSIDITTVFCGFAGESYDDIPTVQKTVGLVPRATRAERVRKIDDISRFAQKLNVNRVAAHIGFIPEEDGKERDELTQIVQQICDNLAARGQVFALETGQETASGLLHFIEMVARPNLKVNFDPANMILYGNDEPIAATEKLFAHIDGVHCKDGCWPTEEGKLGEERPWGEGDVSARRWVETLLQLGYRGTFTIEREISGEQQKRDIAQAREMLESWLRELSTQEGA